MNKKFNIKRIIYLYNRGMSVKNISKQYHCRYKTISSILYSNGIYPYLLRNNRTSKLKNRPNLKKFKHTKNINNLNIIQRAYIAGLFDGEGCITKDKYNNRRIIISQNGTMIHKYLKKIIGCGSIQKVYTSSNHYIFRISAQKQVYEFLLNIYPYSRIKKNKIKYHIQFLYKKYKKAINNII